MQRLSFRQPRPLHFMKFVRNSRPAFGSLVNNNRHQKSPLWGHVTGPVHGQGPLTAEISFVALFGTGRDDGNEKSTAQYLVANLVVPRIPAAELTLIKPDLDTGGPQRIADAAGGPGLLRGIAPENCPGRRAPVRRGLSRHPCNLELVGRPMMPRGQVVGKLPGCEHLELRPARSGARALGR